MADMYKKGLNAQLVQNDLENCCRGEASCIRCQGTGCAIGYAKECIHTYIKTPKKEVPEGTAHVPTMDLKLYDEAELEIAIAHILKECKDCKEDHTEDCIINVIRNCLEVGLLGDLHPYEGSALQYLMYLQKNHPEKAVRIAETYKS